MKKIILLLIVIAFGCSKEEENIANSFVGKQEVTITFDNYEPFTFYSGDYYEAQNTSNATISRIIVEPGDRVFRFTIRDTELFDAFSFGYSDNGSYSISAGLDKENPRFFSSYMGFAQDYEMYNTESSDGLDIAAFYSGDSYDNETAIIGSDVEFGAVDAVRLEVKNMYSNGTETYVNGIREEYPLEMIEGKISFSFYDTKDRFHTLDMEFYLEGDDIIQEPIENVSSSSDSNSNNPLIGKWTQVGVCRNASNNGNSFTFSSNGTGRVFQADCNDSCSGGGVTTNFNYSISGSSVSISPTSVSEYCGVSSAVPSPFTSSWSISGSVLTLDGQDFTKN